MTDELTPTASPKYRQILKAITEKPWAIIPSRLALIADLIAYRMEGHKLTSAEVAERVGVGPAHKQATTAGTIAVLPLYGVITPHSSLMSEISGGTSIDAFRQTFRDLVADPNIGAIVLDVDSPGGMTDLIPEMAAEIRGARGSKPIVAVANTLAASAAYWLASQADELIVTPSGEVGSIGVYAIHDDMSRAMDAEGVTRTYIKAGKFKTEGNPFEPLSDEARAAMQATVDEFYGMLVADVAKGRGVKAADVRDGFGEGRVVTAKNAVSLGMADRVATFDETIAKLARGYKPARASALDSVDMAPVAIASVEADESAGDQIVEDDSAPADEAPALIAGAERLLSRNAIRSPHRG